MVAPASIAAQHIVAATLEPLAAAALTAVVLPVELVLGLVHRDLRHPSCL